MAQIVKTRLKIGLEVHVELATATKMFSRAPNPAGFEWQAVLRGGADGLVGRSEPEPNSCIDPVVLALPGALPVMNREAVRLSMLVGLSLNCSIAKTSRWDRKSYFYPDLPKGYQISQYDLPLCFDGALDVEVDGADGARCVKRIGIVRAHLEEDAGKLLHEMPAAMGGRTLEGSIADYNRAGTPLLEIVTQPDFETADEVVAFARALRDICRFVGATRGVMQAGHIRFEPNINMLLTLDDGRTVATPIAEVKNLNSFKSVRGAIEFEAREQPGRWLKDGREFGPGSKQTRGWDDEAMCTFVRREKEDAHDYRYFPDPDLLPLQMDPAWLESVRASVPELPAARAARYEREFGLSRADAHLLTRARAESDFFEGAVTAAITHGCSGDRAGKATANLMLQSGRKRVAAMAERTDENAQTDETGEDAAHVNELGISAAQLGELAALRESGRVNNQSVDELFGLLCEESQRGVSAGALAAARGMIVVRDESAIDGWCAAAIAEQPKAADDVRAGKEAALGRLVGAAMKHAAGKGDAQTIRERLLAKLSGGANS